VCGEEAPGTLFEFLGGVNGVEVCGGPVGGFQDFAILGDLLQGVGESLGVAGELDGGGVGEVLPLPADGELQQPGEERSENGERGGDNDMMSWSWPPPSRHRPPLNQSPRKKKSEIKTVVPTRMPTSMA
jgi:hypothetical protein